jgi:hypothetical protein
MTLPEVEDLHSVPRALASGYLYARESGYGAGVDSGTHLLDILCGDGADCFRGGDDRGVKARLAATHSFPTLLYGSETAREKVRSNYWILEGVHRRTLIRSLCIPSSI